MLLSAALGASVAAQELALPEAAVKDEAALTRAMPDLAQRAIAVYQESDRTRYLNNLFRLQMETGDYSGALATIQSLKEIWRTTAPASALAVLPFEVLAKAKMKQTMSGINLGEAFKQEFRALFQQLDDKTASNALFWFVGDVNRARDDFNALVEKQKGKDTIALADALLLIRRYNLYRSFQAWTPLTEALTAEDDDRRYIADRDFLVKTPDGARIDVTVVRSRSAKTSLPALLYWTIYAGSENNFGQARNSAARGYAGVVAYTRGKGRSPEEPTPYERDGDDARAIIDWISKQTWSDGRVGMYGGSYGGFAQWAAAKKAPRALKTIVPYVANNPGNGLPMENNIFLLPNYAWAFYVTNNKYLDNEVYFDAQRWNGLNDKWYQSGKSYRDVDKVDGTPNKWLQRWLQHPAYDKYWQSLLPYQSDYAKINIPVLSITGYYGDGCDLYYLKEHYKYNRNANHYLVIGPYDHFGSQGPRKSPVLRGYPIDPVAQIDTPEITFEWMDYIFRGGQKPKLVKDKINYEVMGANEWKHAPSLEKMSNQTLTLYLTDTKAGDRYELSKTKPAKSGSLNQVVDFADRKTTNNNDYYPAPIVGGKPDLSNGFSFISEPFDAPVEVSGPFLGEIKATINKRDLDLGVVLYEVMPNGELFHLAYFIGRASYAKDMSVRRLLNPGKVESIPFDSIRIVSRKLSKGSRLLVTLNVNKHAYAQINYGTGKDVSDEDINDAKIPLQIKWHNDSYVKIPIWK